MRSPMMLVLALVLGGVASASADDATSRSPHGEAVKETAKVTMKGCLREADGERFRLELTDAEGAGKLSTVDLELDGAGAPKAEEVAKHVGHRVEIDGTMSGPEKIDGEAGAAADKPLHRLVVEKIRHLDASCS